MEVMKNLPLELIDEIIGHLPQGDKQSLRNCSLVAKSWINPSQRRLFNTVEIDRSNLQSWLDNISSANAILLGHVRHLRYKEYPKGEIEPAHRALRDYFPSFRQLNHLTLLFAHVSLRSLRIELFSAFQHSLSTISLGCSITKHAFVTLINYFPNLAHLYLYGLDCRKSSGPTPSLSRLLFKSLYITVGPLDTLFLLDELSRSGLRFDEVIVASIIPQPTWPEFSRRVIEIFGARAKYLRIHAAFERKYSLSLPATRTLCHNLSTEGKSFLTLSQCRELSEFEAYMIYADDAELDLISSIASTKIKRIIIKYSPAFELRVGHTYWKKLDNILVRLAERSEYKLTLEVEFRSPYGASDKGQEPDLTRYLPRFVEKGRMIIFDPDEKVLFYSDETKGGR